MKKKKKNKNKKKKNKKKKNKKKKNPRGHQGQRKTNPGIPPLEVDALPLSYRGCWLSGDHVQAG